MNESHETSFLDIQPLHDAELRLVLTERFPGDPSRSFVPAYRFDMRLPSVASPVGCIELRLGSSHFLITYAGQIAYSVVPEHRGHHYAARSCRLLIPLAQRHSLLPLWLTCDPDNWASRRTCELAGAEFIERVTVPTDTKMYQEGHRHKCRYRLSQ